MKPLRKLRLVSCGFATLAMAYATLPAHAAPLALDNVSALDAARQIGEKYGVNIVFKGDFGPTQYVSFTLTDADAAGARLEAVNTLANAVGADFTKTYVVSRVADGQDVPAPKVDANALVVFPATTVSAEQAISMVAAVDDATVRLPADISGSVTLSGTQLGADGAAQQIAAQTHTRWKVFYAMTPRLGGHQLGGKVIDHTNGGSPITELPDVYYAHIPTPAERAAQAAADQAAANQQAASQQAANPQGANNGYAPNGYSPYGNYGDPSMSSGYDYADPYGGYNGGMDGFGGGFSPYGNGGYGNGGYGNGGFSDNGNGLVIDSGGGFDGPIVF